MDREEIKQMSSSLSAYSRTRDLRKMTKSELANMPKEVLIACASNEIADVWEILPKHLREDPDVSKYQYCTEHGHGDEEDVNDGPPTRRLFCCYCKVRDINLANNNTIDVLSNKRSKMADALCCFQ
jgi:hypothetical protein